MKCHICGKTSPLFRQNEKGVPGIWACEEHKTAPVDPTVEEFVDIIEVKYCTCGNSLTANPCIVCGKPKLVTKEYVAKMAKREGDTDPTTGIPDTTDPHIKVVADVIGIIDARKAIAALAAAGYKIMPREPTEVMTEALFIEGYPAMWDAAP